MSISQTFAPGFLVLLKNYRAWTYWLEGALAVVGLAWMSGRRRIWLGFLAWPVLYFAAYSLLGVSRYFWYYAPLVPGFVVLVGLGVSAVAGRASQGQVKHSEGPARLFRSLLAAGLVVVLAAFHFNQVFLREIRPEPRILAYRAAGEWLEANALPEESVGALEVGAIGFYARRPMVDFAGLIQPAIAQELTAGTTYEDAAIRAVLDYQPGYLVLQDGLFPRLFGGYVAEHCQAEVEFSGADYGYEHDLIVYACRQT